MKRIYLTQGKFAEVDDKWFEILNKYKWHARKDGNTFYAYRHVTVEKGKQKIIAMHRVIMEAPDGVLVDHINMDGLCNRVDNLRLCSHSENKMNSRLQSNNKSGERGVFWRERDKRWYAQIRINKKPKHIGSFKNKEDAVEAYKNVATVLFGSFARLS